MRIVVAGHETSFVRGMADRLRRKMPVDEVQFAGSFAEAYNIAEHTIPDLVLVSDAWAEKPEFEGMLSLCSLLGVGCIAVSEDSRKIQQQSRGGATTQRLLAMPTLFEVLDGPNGVQLDAILRLGEPKTQNQSHQFDGGIVLLGASTGGVDALLRILEQFPPNCPPTFVVQHMGGRFKSGLAPLLDAHVKPRVLEADPGIPPKSGEVYVAPVGAGNLLIRHQGKLRAHFSPANATQSHCPSVDELFVSAVPLGQRVSAALLTGMGRDGAKGLLALRQAGASTFAQDAASSVVFGMPKAAMEYGAVDRTLPLDKISAALLASRRRGA